MVFDRCCIFQLILLPATPVVIRDHAGNVSLSLFNLCFKGPGRQTQRAVAQNDHLLQPVRGSHPHPVMTPQIASHTPVKIAFTASQLAET